jgi:hypothetical protein
MSYFYPQAVCTLRIRWENFNNANDSILQDNYTLRVLAKNITVTINDYTRADTFSATIDYSEFPFDPRTIRALGITVHLEDKRQLFITNKNSKNFNQLNLIEAKKENTIFQGFADEESIDFNDTTREVKFEGRDFTSLLIDAPYSGKALELGVPLNLIIKQLVNQLPATQDLTVENRTGGILPTIASYAPDYNPLGTGRSSKKKEKYWDVITEIVQRAGLIAYIELDKLVITRPRVLYSQSKPYQFIYGKNLSSLNFSRKLGRQKGVNIIIRSLNIERKEVLEVKIPEQATVEWAQSIGVARSRQKIQKVDKDGDIKEEDAPFLTFNVPNIANIDQLIEIGEGVYEEIGRQQIEGSIETKEMCILQDEGVEFDVTKIRNGTPIKIEIDQGDLEGIGRIKSVAARERFLIARCYEEKVARALARTLGKFETRFYTRSVEFSLDASSGFKMSLDFVNFIELDNKSLGLNG